MFSKPRIQDTYMYEIYRLYERTELNQMYALQLHNYTKLTTNKSNLVK